MNGEVSFDSNNLQTFNPATKTGIITSDIDHIGSPDKIVQLFAKASANGSAIPNIEYPSKRVIVKGSIHGSTSADLDDRIDTFKGYFTGKAKNLDITYSTGTRRYIATPRLLPMARRQRAHFATFKIVYICTEPFGLDTANTDLWAAKTGFTSSSFTETPTIAGSAPVQYPVITITINAFTGSGDYIQVTNDNNNQGILVSGANLAVNDVVEIDCKERTVKLNAVEIDYYGTFLELEPGAAAITYIDGFATRSVDVEGVYSKRWL